MLCIFDLSIINIRRISSLQKESPAKDTVAVIVARELPRTVRITEIDIPFELRADRFVFAELLAVVKCLRLEDFAA